MTQARPALRIRGLDPARFAHLFGLTEVELARHGVVRRIADGRPVYPDRVEIRDPEPGEPMLLLNYTHQPADTPYRASHAIYVREGATTPYDALDRVPEALRRRDLSLRAIDAAGMLTGAELAPGTDLEAAAARLLADPTAAYLHVHYARPGCYAARIDRA
jgi:hypothetical protein